MADSRTSSAVAMSGSVAPRKVMCHCMFGVLALTADQLVRLVT